MTSLSESFIHLDMTGAVKDIRRFNFVRKVRFIAKFNESEMLVPKLYLRCQSSLLPYKTILDTEFQLLFYRPILLFSTPYLR